MTTLLPYFAQFRTRIIDHRYACISIGSMAILMPFVLIAGDIFMEGKMQLQPSLSHYYYTKIGGLFVACLLLFSCFLLLDQTATPREKAWTLFASICGFGTVALPTTPIGSKLDFVYTLHLIFALSLFISVAILAIRHYAKKSTGIIRQYFRWAGYGLLISLAGLIAFFVIVTLSGGHTVDSNVVLYIEIFMIALLGSVWLVKGLDATDREK